MARKAKIRAPSAFLRCMVVPALDLQLQLTRKQKVHHLQKPQPLIPKPLRARVPPQQAKEAQQLPSNKTMKNSKNRRRSEKREKPKRSSRKS
jgi:hypothetical protein